MTLDEIGQWLSDRRALLNAGSHGAKQWVVIFSMDDPHNCVQSVHDDREQAMYWAMACFDLPVELRIRVHGKEPAKC